MITIKMIQKSFVKRISQAGLVFLPLIASQAISVPLNYSNDDFSVQPESTGRDVKPLVMLAMSNDHQLFFKAYSDWGDLDGDGQIDVTYTHSINYEGYFDYEKCYEYSTSLQRFVPKLRTPARISNTSGGLVENDNYKYCDASNGSSGQAASNLWSGNFLNWASMTRMDVIRRILYGGKRVEDTSTRTVLERAHLPNDSHSFAKFYNGGDLARLTPFSQSVAPDGITMCNTTVERDYVNGSAPSGNLKSQDSTAPPLLRVVRGNYRLWASNERLQCLYSEEVDNHAVVVSESNQSAGKSDIDPVDIGILGAELESPSADKQLYPDGTNGIGFSTIEGGDIVVRVEACVSGNGTNGLSLIGNEECQIFSKTDASGATSANFKPTGVLLDNIKDDRAHFGLMTGTYANNKQGGVLRKNIVSMQDEIDFEGDGTLISTATTLNNANQTKYVPGIIKTIDSFRVLDYRYTNGGYFDNSEAGKLKGRDCIFGQAEFDNGQCVSWGNPFSEIVYECYRYMFGKSATPSFLPSSADNRDLDGSPFESDWDFNLDNDNYCANLSLIAFNASVSSYDDDNIESNDLIAKTSLDTITDTIGSAELDSGIDYFYGQKKGQTPADDTEFQLCAPKPIAGTPLSQLLGICPEAPGLEGGYAIAGLAHYGFANFSNPNITDQSALDELSEAREGIRFYGVSMATNLPIIELDTVVEPAGEALKPEVTIIPACTNRDTRLFESVPEIAGENESRTYVPTELEPGSCALVDFIPVGQPDASSGTYYVIWEDTEQGSDFDSDVIGNLSYEVTGDQITVTTDTLAQSTGGPMGFGFTISGVTKPGIYFPSGVLGFNLAGTACASDADGCTVEDSPVALSAFTISPGGAESIPQPLELASKWGNFDDNRPPEDAKDCPTGQGPFFNDQGTVVCMNPATYQPVPNDDNEFDNRINATGTSGRDGTPDNFFAVTNPLQLKKQLRRILENILERESSGSSAAIIQATARGEGAIYQAVYAAQTDRTNADGLRLQTSWTGSLNALFLDAYGHIRMDDGSTAGVLDDSDSAIVYRFDQRRNRTVFDSYKVVTNGVNAGRLAPTTAPTDDALLGQPFLTGSTLSNIVPIWSAVEELASIAQGDSAILNQRAYSADADTGRYIFTAVAARDNASPSANVVTAGDVIPFTLSTQTLAAYDPGNIGASKSELLEDYERYFDIDSADPAAGAKLVAWMRGYNVPEFRSRDTFDASGNKQRMLLGDIIHSSPIAVTAPQENYDVLYNDTSYAQFKEQYRNRRHMVYAGANDGMLHAFNGGFFDPVTTTFTGDETADGHPLGAEMWSYVPYNLLPHLKWLTDPDYSHVYYVDGEPQVFDVNIFDASDPDHPGGWGTILVVGMRLGGSEYAIDTNGDGVRDTTTNSAYIIMDVTNPEVAPTLIAEVSHPDLGYTLAKPALVKRRDTEAASTTNDWYLVFGSGPRTSTQTSEFTVLSEVVSEEPARLFSLKLDGALPVLETIVSSDFDSTTVDDSFVATLTPVDWDQDYEDDVVYIGTVSDNPASTDGYGGGVFRLKIDFTAGVGLTPSVSRFVDNLDRPVTGAPHTFSTSGTGGAGEQWVYFGTGRFLVSEDRKKNSTDTFFGVKEPNANYNAEVSFADLVDTSGVQVFSSASPNLGGAGQIRSADGTLFTVDTNPVPTFNELLTTIEGKSGWRFNLGGVNVGVAEGGDSNSPTVTGAGTRNVTSPTSIAQLVVLTAFEPSVVACKPEGSGFLLAPHLRAGVAPPSFAPLGNDSTNIFNTDGAERVNLGQYIGVGNFSSPQVVETAKGGTEIVTQSDTAEVVKVKLSTGSVSTSRQSWREVIEIY